MAQNINDMMNNVIRNLTSDPDSGREHNPESRSKAEARAERLGFPKSNVICLEGDNWCYIVPHGITDPKAKRAYAECRRKGGDKGTCAAVAHNIQKGR